MSTSWFKGYIYIYSFEDSASHILATPHPREVPLLATAVPAATPAPYIDLTFIA